MSMLDRLKSAVTQIKDDDEKKKAAQAAKAKASLDAARAKPRPTEPKLAGFAQKAKTAMASAAERTRAAGPALSSADREKERRKNTTYLYTPDGARKTGREMSNSDIMAWLPTVKDESLRTQYAQQFQADLKNPSSRRYDPYYTDKSNNDEARALFGRDTFDESFFQTEAQPAYALLEWNASRTSPLAPTKKGVRGTPEYAKAYKAWHMETEDEPITRNAELEMGDLRGAITDMVSLGSMSEDDIYSTLLDGDDFKSSYPTLNKLRAAKSEYTYKLLNRPVHAGDESIRAIIRAAQRGEDVSQDRDYLLLDADYRRSQAEEWERGEEAARIDRKANQLRAATGLPLIGTTPTEPPEEKSIWEQTLESLGRAGDALSGLGTRVAQDAGSLLRGLGFQSEEERQNQVTEAGAAYLRSLDNERLFQIAIDHGRATRADAELVANERAQAGQLDMGRMRTTSDAAPGTKLELEESLADHSAYESALWRQYDGYAEKYDAHSVKDLPGVVGARVAELTEQEAELLGQRDVLDIALENDRMFMGEASPERQAQFDALTEQIEQVRAARDDAKQDQAAIDILYKDFDATMRGEQEIQGQLAAFTPEGQIKTLKDQMSQEARGMIPLEGSAYLIGEDKARYDALTQGVFFADKYMAQFTAQEMLEILQQTEAGMIDKTALQTMAQTRVQENIERGGVSYIKYIELPPEEQALVREEKLAYCAGQSASHVVLSELWAGDAGFRDGLRALTLRGQMAQQNASEEGKPGADEYYDNKEAYDAAYAALNERYNQDPDVRTAVDLWLLFGKPEDDEGVQAIGAWLDAYADMESMSFGSGDLVMDMLTDGAWASWSGAQNEGVGLWEAVSTGTELGINNYFVKFPEAALWLSSGADEVKAWLSGASEVERSEMTDELMSMVQDFEFYSSGEMQYLYDYGTGLESAFALTMAEAVRMGLNMAEGGMLGGMLGPLEGSKNYELMTKMVHSLPSTASAGLSTFTGKYQTTGDWGRSTAAGALSAVVEAATESQPIDNFITSIFGDAAMEMSVAGIQRASQVWKDVGMSWARDTVLNANAEGIQEVLSGIGNAVIDTALFGDDFDWNDQQALNDYWGGFSVSLLFGAAALPNTARSAMYLSGIVQSNVESNKPMTPDQWIELATLYQEDRLDPNLMDAVKDAANASEYVDREVAIVQVEGEHLSDLNTPEVKDAEKAIRAVEAGIKTMDTQIEREAQAQQAASSEAMRLVAQVSRDDISAVEALPMFEKASNAAEAAASMQQALTEQRRQMDAQLAAANAERDAARQRAMAALRVKATEIVQGEIDNAKALVAQIGQKVYDIAEAGVQANMKLTRETQIARAMAGIGTSESRPLRMIDFSGIERQQVADIDAKASELRALVDTLNQSRFASWVWRKTDAKQVLSMVDAGMSEVEAMDDLSRMNPTVEADVEATPEAPTSEAIPGSGGVAVDPTLDEVGITLQPAEQPNLSGAPAIQNVGGVAVDPTLDDAGISNGDIENLRNYMKGLGEADVVQHITEDPDVRASIDKLSALAQQSRDIVSGLGDEAIARAARETAGKVLRTFHSKFDRQTLVDDLTALYTGVIGTVDWQDTVKLASDLGAAVIDQSKNADRHTYEQYADLRKTLRNTAITLTDAQKAEVASVFGSYNAFRKTNFGRLNLKSEGGIGLDSLWMELSGQNPELFDAAVSEGDQPIALVEALDALKPVYRNLYGVDEGAAALDAGMNMLLDFFDVAIQGKGDVDAEKAHRAAKQKVAEVSAMYQQSFKALANAISPRQRSQSNAERPGGPKVITREMLAAEGKMIAHHRPPPPPKYIRTADIVTAPDTYEPDAREFGGKEIKRASQITKALFRELNIPHTSRYQSAAMRAGKVLGEFYRQSGVIVTKARQDIQTAAHEIGHAIFERSDVFDGVNPKPEYASAFENMRGKLSGAFVEAYTKAGHQATLYQEAAAEFVRQYLTDRNAAVNFAGDDFVRQFETKILTSKELESVKKARKEFNYLMNAEDVERSESMIASNADKPKNQLTWKKILTAVADKYVRFMDFDAAARDAGYENDSPDQRAYTAMSHLAYSGDRAGHLIEEALRTPDGQIVGPSLQSVMDAVRYEDKDAFSNYLLRKHDIDRQAQGKPVFGGDTAENSLMQVLRYERMHPEFKEAQQRLMKWWNTFTDEWIVKTNAIPNAAEAIAHFRELYPNYVPTFRSNADESDVFEDYMMDRGGALGQAMPRYKAATGSDMAINSPIENIVLRTQSLVAATDKVRAMRKFHEVLEVTPGLGEYAREIDPPQGGVQMNSDVIRILDKDGGEHYYQIMDPILHSVLLGDPGEVHGVFRAIGKFTGLFKRLTTMNNPFFTISNAFRDFVESYTKGTSVTPVDHLMDWTKAFVEVLTGMGSEVDNYYAAGGGDSSIAPESAKGVAAMERTLYSQYFKGSLKRALNQNLSAKQRAGEVFNSLRAASAKVSDAINHLNNVIETTSRYAEFKRQRGQGTVNTIKRMAGADVAVQSVATASRAAMDVTTDFRRAGRDRVIKSAGQIFAFMNAGIQGTYGVYRMLREGKYDPKKVAAYLTKSAAMFALIPLLLKHLIGQDEKDKEAYDLIAENVKRDNYLIPMHWLGMGDENDFFKIPKPKGLPAALGDAMGRALIEAMEHEGSWAEFAKYGLKEYMGANVGELYDAIDPYGSPIFAPVIQIMMNRTWYGSPIESEWMGSNNLSKELRIKDTTSSVGIALANLPGLKGNVSPIQVDYFINQMFGVAGDLALSEMGDKLVETFKGGSWADVGKASMDTVGKMLEARIKTNPTAASDMTSAMYDMVDYMTGIVADANESGSSPRFNPRLTDAEQRIAIKEADKMTRKGGVLYVAKNNTSAYYKEIKAIMSGSGSAEQKNLKVREVKYRMLMENAAAVRFCEEYIRTYIKGTPAEYAALRKVG